MKRLFFAQFVALTGLAACTALAHAGSPSPADWRDEAIYQVITDRFFNGDTLNDNAEGARGTTNGGKVHGGDWLGLEQKLDYIQTLGATSIWISPVVLNKSGAYHGYGAKDFNSYSPQFGNLVALRHMIDAAHARGMHVIIDIVCNHTADYIYSTDSGYPAFKNPGTYTLKFHSNSDTQVAPFNNLAWYHNNGAIDQYIDPNQNLGELSSLDDLFTERQDVRDALFSAYSNLITNTDCDGFRIDTVKHVDQGFWQDWAPRIHGAAAAIGKTNFFMFGEVYDGSDTLNGRYTGTKTPGPYELDSVLHYPLFFKTTSVFVSGGATSQISDAYDQLPQYDPEAQSRLVTFLDNHDQPRFLSKAEANGDTTKLKPALVFQLLSIGVPCVYYGTEQAFEGNRAGSQSNDPYDREDMFAGGFEFGTSVGDNFNETHPMFLWTQRLMELRRDYPLFRRGTQSGRWRVSGAGIYAFSRILDGNEAVVTVNNSGSSYGPVTITTGLAEGTVLTDLLTNTTFGVVGAGGQLPLTVPGRGSYVLMDSTMAIPAPPVVTQITPAHDSSNIDYSEFVVQFNTAMDPASVQAAFSMSPPLSVQFRQINPTTFGFLPTQQMNASAIYAIRIAPTAQELAGPNSGAPRTLPAKFESRFHSAATQTSPPPPSPVGWELH